MTAVPGERQVPPGPEWALLAFFALTVPGTVLFVLLQHWGVLVPQRDAAGQPGPATVAWGLVCQAANCLCVMALWRLRPPDADLIRRGTLPALRSYGLFLLAWLPLGLVGYLWALRALGHPVLPQPHLVFLAHAGAGQPAFWLGLVLAVGLGPLAEELVFRGWLQGTLRQRLGPTVALWATALLFGLVHGLDKALPLFLLGLLFGWLRERHGGLWAPLLVHAVHNSVTIGAVLLWPGHLDLLYPP